MDNNRKIISKFDNTKYAQLRDFNSVITGLDHKEITKQIKKFNIINPYDYARSCDNHGFTDLYFNTAGNILNSNSKYIITKNSKNGPIYLSFANFNDFYLELIERFKKTGQYDIKHNRIKGHFTDENVLRFGNKSVGYLYTEFKVADVYKLVKQKSYTFNLTHEQIQAHLCAIGGLLKEDTKVARGEKNKNVYNENFKDIATIHNLEITTIEINKVKEAIDFIDVLWLDSFYKEIVAAFEVEISRKWVSALNRLANLSLAINSCNKKPIFTIVSNSKYFSNISAVAQTPLYRYAFKDTGLKFLPIESFIELLSKINKDSNVQYENLRKDFLSILININVEPMNFH